MRELIVLSPCFYEDAEPAKLMLNSATVCGLTVMIYGVGEQFIPHGADAQVKHLFETMKKEKLADHVLVTDCRDVLFQANEAEIMDKFQSLGSSLVMSAEAGCWPPEPETMAYYAGRDPNGYDYVNAGQYIGTWEYVIGCLDFLLFKYRNKHPGADNSQGWWMWAKMRGELDFALDSECQIFQTMSGGAGAQIGFKGNRAVNRLTGTSPCSIHYNGNPGEREPHLEMYRRLMA